MIPNVRLSLPNKAENVLVVRQALTGVAECLGLDAILTNDLNTAVTEACNNVVLHAYGGGEGRLEVDVCAQAGAVTVVVRDHGRGMPEREPDDAEREDAEGKGFEEAHGGLGLAVIDALSRHVELTQPPGGGTEVRMELAAPTARALEPVADDDADQLVGPAQVGPAAQATHEGRVELQLAPTAIARAVLPRVLSTLAARAYFSTDRISDVQLVADVLAANAGDSISGSHLDVGVSVASRDLALRIGPLHAGRGDSLVATAADGLAPVIERLTDERHRVARADSGEMLELRLVDRR
ncbi:MAG TPA: ATP-binding protein [Solirubrobacteraceae bacterium]|nr:ATP-binding protein [Solirubrobacteraceae bacterium]